ncbi:hypothetical protein B4135_2056 [Caldibacillus debilis]|uniref:Uncharacterized protein n=1 Tax=Caldibacillus debilis TaxID=301148 RepID=A0A150M4J6_9BACI|nr:hypothetical protein B4135_2056 [Caldibacillus debilis]
MPPFSRPGDEGAGPPMPREAAGRTARQILSVTCYAVKKDKIPFLSSLNPLHPCRY